MASDDNGKAPDGGEDPRLNSLEERLKAAHRSEAERTAPMQTGNAFTGKGVSQGNRVLSILIGSPLGGLVVGLALDQVLGTRPWVMLALLFLGLIAAFVQVWRISKERVE